MLVNSVDNMANWKWLLYLSYSCQQLVKHATSSNTNTWLFYQPIVKTSCWQLKVNYCKFRYDVEKLLILYWKKLPLSTAWIYQHRYWQFLTIISRPLCWQLLTVPASYPLRPLSDQKPLNNRWTVGAGTERVRTGFVETMKNADVKCTVCINIIKH